MSLHFSGNLGLLAQQTPENRGNPLGSRPAEGDFTPNMGWRCLPPRDKVHTFARLKLIYATDLDLRAGNKLPHFHLASAGRGRPGTGAGSVSDGSHPTIERGVGAIGIGPSLTLPALTLTPPGPGGALPDLVRDCDKAGSYLQARSSSTSA